MKVYIYKYDAYMDTVVNYIYIQYGECMLICMYDDNV